MRIVTSRSVLVSAAVLALASGWLSTSAPTSLAQPSAAQTPIKVAIANPSHIFSELAEFKVLQTQMQDEQKKFVATQDEKVKAITDMKNRRDALLPAHPQWAELNSQLAAMSAEFKVWRETQKIIAETNQKSRMLALFKKIEQGVAEIAKQEQIDLVIADNRDPLPNPDEVELAQLRAGILSRDVLFSADRLDITEKVVTLLDAKFRGIAAAPVK